MSRLESLPKDQQDAILERWDEGRQRRKPLDKKAREAVDNQTKGVEFLKDKNIGLKEGQGGDVRELIKKWLRASERGVGHSQDTERGERHLERIKSFFYSKLVPTLETFPREEFIRVQNETALAQGRGRVADQVSAEIINQGINQEIGNIKDSLDPWIEYFTSPDSSSFPIWAKYWAFLGVVKMSGKMKTDEVTGKVSFPKRETNTIYGFPELNPEALAKAVDYILALVEKGQKLDTILTKVGFSGVYAHYISELKGGLDQTELQITEGTWVKYDQGNDDEAIDTLVGSLQGKFTNWCTAGRSTAESQLSAGDFYVYYTKSASGKPNPRIAIRMEGDRIVEVRGIAANQNLDDVIAGTNILDQKLIEFGEEGEIYKVKAENMRRLTVIYNKLRKDFTYHLSDEDLNFLEGKPEGFGYREDPRIHIILSFSELRKKYNITEFDDTTIDRIISGGGSKELSDCIEFVNPKLHLNIANRLIEKNCDNSLLEKIYNNFKELNNSQKIEIVNKWVNLNRYLSVMDLSFLKSAEGLNLPESIGGILDLSSLTSADGLNLPENISGDLYLTKLTSADGLNLPKSVGGNLYLPSITSAEGLNLQVNIGGNLDLSSLTSADGLNLPENISGDLDLRRIKSADGLNLPKSVEGNLDLGGLTSADGLNLPESIGGNLVLGGLRSADGLNLPKSVGGNLVLGGLRSADGLNLPKSVGGSLDLFSLTSADGLNLPENISGDLYLTNLTSADGLNLPKSVGGILDLGSLTSAEGLNLQVNIGGNLDLSSLTSADGLNLPESIGGSLNLGGLRSADGLNLPKSVGGNLLLGSLTSAEGLNLPESIGGSLNLGGLRSADGLNLPESVGGNLVLGGLRSADGLNLPNSVGGNLDLTNLTSADGLIFPRYVGGNLFLSRITSADGSNLPERVGGYLYLDRLTSADGLIFPISVGVNLDLRSLTSASGLTMPENIGANLLLGSLTSAEGLNLPESIGGSLFISGDLPYSEREKFIEIARSRSISVKYM